MTAEFLTAIRAGRYANLRSSTMYSPITPRALLSDQHVVQRVVDSGQSSICFATTDDHACLLEATESVVKITVGAVDSDALDQAIGGFERRSNELAGHDDRARVTTWSSCDPRVRYLRAPMWDEIQRNYPAEVGEQLARLMHLPPLTAEASLILWHGPPGTGKTSAARALIRHWSWCDAHYIFDPDDFLSSGYYLRRFMESELAQARGNPRLIVLEDVDSVLRDDTREKAHERLRALLNLTDGMFTDLGLTFLVTTNLPRVSFDAALTRPGRCVAAIDFRPFTPAEARNWLGEGAPVPRAEEQTLAALFARQNGSIRLVKNERDQVGLYL